MVPLWLGRKECKIGEGKTESEKFFCTNFTSSSASLVCDLIAPHLCISDIIHIHATDRPAEVGDTLVYQLSMGGAML